MKRSYEDAQWSVPVDEKGVYHVSHAQLAALMDIRRELKKLNAVFSCKNFQNVPKILKQIRKNTNKEGNK